MEALADAGVGDVTATYRARPPFEGHRAHWKKVDLLELSDARGALAGAKVGILCAGKVSTAAELRRDPVRSVMDTLRIGTNALEAAAHEKVERLILLSSCSGYPEGAGPKEEAGMFVGNPPASWFGVGWMHRFLEKQLEWYAAHLGRIASAVALRPTLVYGPYDDFSRESGHFVPSMIGQVVARQRPIEVWGDGSQTRNLIHAADVASAVVAALVAEPGYAAYNIAAPLSTSVNTVLKTLIDLDGFSDAEIVHRLDRSSGASALDVSAAAFAQRFGWRPALSLREGLADTVQWYRRSIVSAR
jgi:GDP-L-fucose synthase